MSTRATEHTDQNQFRKCRFPNVIFPFQTLKLRTSLKLLVVIKENCDDYFLLYNEKFCIILVDYKATGKSN